MASDNVNIIRNIAMYIYYALKERGLSTNLLVMLQCV